MPTTFPAINVGQKSKRKRSERVLVADFGDGYAQTAPDGVNTAVEEWSLSFDDYSITDIKTITDFLDGLRSSTAFFWTPPDETVAKLWRQTGDYDVSFDGPTTRSLNVSIKRVYTL